MKRLFLAFLLTALPCAGGAADLKVTPGTASGYIRVDGKEYPTRHSYALWVGDSYWLLLTDAEVPNESFQNPIKFMSVGTDGKTHGLRLTLDAKGKPDPIMILQVESVTSNLDWQTFELSKLGKDVLEGKTRTLALHKGAEKSYEYDISFNAPVTAVK